jgi:hypothetical protein
MKKLVSSEYMSSVAVVDSAGAARTVPEVRAEVVKVFKAQVEIPACFNSGDAIRVQGFDDELSERAAAPAEGFIDGRCEPA